MTKSGADRVRAHRLRKQQAGLVEIRVWVRPDQVERVRKYVKRLEGKG